MELVTVDSDCAADVDNCVVFAKEPGIHQFPVAANILAILIDSAKEYILVIQSRMLYTKLGKRNFQRSTRSVLVAVIAADLSRRRCKESL